MKEKPIRTDHLHATPVETDAKVYAINRLFEVGDYIQRRQADFRFMAAVFGHQAESKVKYAALMQFAADIQKEIIRLVGEDLPE